LILAPCPAERDREIAPEHLAHLARARDVLDRLACVVALGHLLRAVREQAAFAALPLHLDDERHEALFERG